MQTSIVKTFALVALLVVPACLLAQEGTSSMSMSIGRAGVSTIGPNGRFVMPTPDMFRIEEMINYHRHDIPIPTGEQRVKLDVQQVRLGSGKSVLQLGLATPHDLDSERVPPLNLVLVIDRSSSMSGSRIANVKSSLHSFVQKLRRNDKVTIVGFSSTAAVHLEASHKTKTKKIREAIDSIHANGSTNLHAGLMLGYQQAEANFDPERTNRVILLTDGRTNTGQVDLNEIARESKAFNKKGIDLSTIGLGNDLNHELLRELADSGRGLIHFVADEKDIEKTFVTEVESLLAPAARKVKLTVDFGSVADSVKIYGYSPERSGSKYVFKLDDLNHGATQVVMVKMPKQIDETVTATLRYKDAITTDVVEQSVSVSNHFNEEVLGDAKRNYAIAVVAGSIKRAAAHSNEGECEKAAKRLRKGMAAADKLIGHREDENVNRVAKIAADYEKDILRSIARNRD